MSRQASLVDCLLFAVVAAAATSELRAQTVETRSLRLDVLRGAERASFLTAHNSARRAVDLEPVSWSDDLSADALDSLRQQQDQLIETAKSGWAKRQIPLPAHPAATKYGQNVAAWMGDRGHAAEWAVELWLREKPSFDKLNVDGSYRMGDEAGKTEIDDQGQKRPVVVGHYTAIVWRTTRQIGAARLESQLADAAGDIRTYVAVICDYDPPGNRLGQKPY